MGELGAYLVVASCLELDLQQRTAVLPCFEQTVAERRAFGAVAARRDDDGFEIVVDQPVLQFAVVFRRTARDKGAVDFSAGAVADLLREARQGFRRPREEDDAAGLPVDAVDGFQKDIARLVELVFDEQLGLLLQTVAVRSGRLCQEVVRLVRREQVVV